MMRLTDMNRLVPAALSSVLFISAIALPAAAQGAAGGQADTFRDTSMVKPPAGSRVAIYEFEDLECPACAHAAPIIHAAVEKYKIPLVRHDFPLKMHVWSFDAAITARYLQDKVSPKTAEDFRRDVFANQTGIASKDDLANFTRHWFQSHNLLMPFVMDPAGLFRAEVQADETLGERLGVTRTPTIFVATNKGWVQILDPNYTYQTIDAALAQTAPAAKAPVKASLHK